MPLRSDAGMATVEGAIVLCALVVFLGLALGAVVAVTDQLRCIDAAREAARLAARGESGRARAAAAQIAPRGARIDIRFDGDTIAVQVDAAPAGNLLSGLRVAGHAYAVAEPSFAGAGSTP
ncbi:MAG: TadE family type IV pilus minor pilin [Labedaea sp.]